MRNHTLKITDIEVSAICLGTMYFGTVIDTATSYNLLDRYTDAGGGFLDTANNYATWSLGGQGGESEALLGRWMRKRGNRSRLVVASKVGFAVPADGTDAGLSPGQIESECEKSLKRLGIETLDIYYAHQDDRSTPLEQILEALYRLVKAGKVRFVGASNFLTWRLVEARWISRTEEWPEFCCIQQRFSYLRPVRGADFNPQVAASSELLDFCRSRGVRLLAYSPLLGGTYSRADRAVTPHYQSSGNDSRLAVLKTVARELNATPNQVVLAWLIQSEPEVIPVLGVSRPEQLDENLGALDITLSEDQVFRLSSAGNIATAHFEAQSGKSRLSK